MITAYTHKLRLELIDQGVWIEPPPDIPLDHWVDAVMGGYTDRYLPARTLDLSKEELQRQMYDD